ncbi:putative ABC transporter permease [Murimonas intestini]|uniref:ABC transporter type IV n=1 Tax=Murimonas intestini TaxID=1337051 RepID=A0AB73T2I1_9FIRM|nr:putative ABC transporter permease [Murimonas intestini]MCR1841827.1 putative ABC transporter permease [Murimonas intestini]MCR1865643.1 putative ABC transporter permease [Murimonas intestini]MCR1883776.1 putative ABC transporter permease [Murimonas intestini]
MKKIMNNTCYWTILFFTGGIIGWLLEMIAFKGSHVNVSWIEIVLNLRGVLHGPWVPIYGFGFILLVLFGHKLKKYPIFLFIGNIVICGLLEYVTSYVLELIFNARWWDYSSKFLNLHGRIYVGGLLMFGIAGMLAVYLIEPWMRARLERINPCVKVVFAVLLITIFCVDVVVALQSPNLGMGVSIIGGK